MSLPSESLPPDSLPSDSPPPAFPPVPGSAEPIQVPTEPDQQIDRLPGMQQGSVPRVGLIMGSQSDWETLSHAATLLDTLGISFETRIVSAHRTPDRLAEYAATARGRGICVIIAGAGGAAHLPG